jgi:hypothetical protein
VSIVPREGHCRRQNTNEKLLKYAFATKTSRQPDYCDQPAVEDMGNQAKAENNAYVRQSANQGMRASACQISKIKVMSPAGQAV